MTKTILIILGVIIAGAVGWYLFSPLLFDDTVDEAFPEITIPTEEEIMAMPEDQREAMRDELMEKAASMPDKEMDEKQIKLPSQQITNSGDTSPSRIKSGLFTGADDFHQGSGRATIYRLQNDVEFLRLTNFSVTNGPALHVLLTKSPDGSLADGYLDLGDLKGNKGNQNYGIPEGEDINEYKGVNIYCKPFQVTFATASLQ